MRGTFSKSVKTRLSTRFLKDTSGSTMAMMAAGLVVAIACLGGAIDAGRMYIVKSQLQAGVDAAALAGARAFGVTDSSPNSRTKQVDSYFDGNFPRNPAYMGTVDIQLNPTFQVVNGVNVTTVNASATLDMSFMRLFGFGRTTVSAVAKAELQPRPLEVMVVLDNTGSMRFNLSNGKTRIVALKEAANSFVDILFQGGTQRKDLALGFIPYDVTVNVGKLLPSGSVTPLNGFNAGSPGTRYAWKGCVMNDTTVRDVSSDRTVSEPNAWDLTRTLPGEGSNPAVMPYFVPPMYVPALYTTNTAELGNKNSDFYKIGSGEQRNNLYRLDSGNGMDLANSAAYRSWLYDYYIGLNYSGSAQSAYNVVRATDGSYFDPTSGNRSTSNWYIDTSRIPYYNDSSYWSAPATGTVNSNGGVADSFAAAYTTPMPTPNWQCPEEAMLPLYNRQKTDYSAYIRDKNAAIYPGNGTIHHAGLLWAYRLLVRDDKFPRPRPSGMSGEQAKRAIVFMTDGINDVDEDQNGYRDRTFTWYGRWSDRTISARADDAETQMLRRFSKTCSNIQREPNAPQVYIIALVANSSDVNTAFDNCAPGRVYRTSSSTQLNAAFQSVAAELIDLHLVQ